MCCQHSESQSRWTAKLSTSATVWFDGFHGMLGHFGLVLFRRVCKQFDSDCRSTTIQGAARLPLISSQRESPEVRVVCVDDSTCVPTWRSHCCYFVVVNVSVLGETAIAEQCASFICAIPDELGDASKQIAATQNLHCVVTLCDGRRTSSLTSPLS